MVFEGYGQGAVEDLIQQVGTDRLRERMRFGCNEFNLETFGRNRSVNIKIY